MTLQTVRVQRCGVAKAGWQLLRNPLFHDKFQCACKALRMIWYPAPRPTTISAPKDFKIRLKHIENSDFSYTERCANVNQSS